MIVDFYVITKNAQLISKYLLKHIFSSSINLLLAISCTVIATDKRIMISFDFSVVSLNINYFILFFSF